MPYPSRRRDGSTRRALLDAAQEAFATRGFSGTSVRSLTSAVGIKESSFYNHFPSKQALLEAVLDRASQRLAETAERLAVPLEDADAAAGLYGDMSLQRLEEVTAGFARLWLTDPDLVAARRALVLEQFRTPEAGARLRDLTVNQPLTFQTRLFAELIERGRFSPADPQAVAMAFWGPVRLILAGASGPEDLQEVLRRIHLHLEHFAATHLSDSGSSPAVPAEDSRAPAGSTRPRPTGTREHRS